MCLMKPRIQALDSDSPISVLGLSRPDGQDLEQELQIQLIQLIKRYEPVSCDSFDRFLENQAKGGENHARS